MQFVCHRRLVRDEMREHGEEACYFVLDRTDMTNY